MLVNRTFGKKGIEMSIDVTGIDLVAFAKAAYELSSPQGLGFLQTRAGPLPDEDAKSLINGDQLHMDYVHGRAVKMFLRMEDGKLIAPDSWYDHTHEQYDELLAQFGITRETKAEHGIACNCEKCQPNSPMRDAERVFTEICTEPAIVNAWETKKQADRHPN